MRLKMEKEVELKQIPPEEPHMHQPVCPNHYDTEVRLQIVERDMREMRGEVSEIRGSVATISHDIKNLQQSNYGLVEGIKCLNDTNLEIIRKNGELQDRIGKEIKESAVETQKMLHDLIYKIVYLIVGVGALIVTGRLLDISSFLI